MTWQDIVITAASIIFSLALVPQVWLCFKNKRCDIAYATSLPTFLGLYAICAAYVTLKLFASAVVCFITGTLWLILFLQKVKYGKKLSTPTSVDITKNG